MEETAESNEAQRKKYFWLDTAGWIAVALIIGAYFANTTGLLPVTSLAYGLLNFFGALGIVATSYPKRNWQPVALNTVWALIAIYGIMRAVLAL